MRVRTRHDRFAGVAGVLAFAAVGALAVGAIAIGRLRFVEWRWSAARSSD